MNRIPSSVLAALLIAGSIGGVGRALADQPRAGRHITVSAIGTVSATPDLAHISTGVVVDQPTARQALTANSASMRRVLEQLKSTGIAARDIQTSEVSIRPRYQSFRDNTPPTLIGYRVSNQVSITVREVARLGEVLDKAVEAGANQLGGIRFDVSNEETLKDAARRQAVENAKRRAALYAQAAGVRLGQVLTISEAGAEGPGPLVQLSRASAKGVPVEAGSHALRVRVHITWALEPAP